MTAKPFLSLSSNCHQKRIKQSRFLPTIRLPRKKESASRASTECNLSSALCVFLLPIRIEKNERFRTQKRNQNPCRTRRFQKPTPFPKSIFENVAYGLRVAGISSRSILAEKVEESLRRAALWEEVKDRLNESALGLSGGQQQRLCIARALAVEPEVLLMDEPCSALDPIATQRVEESILELKQSLCIVIVTHNMQQAARVSDKTAFFFMGKLIEFDDTDTIFNNAANVRTRDYVNGRFG